MKLPIIFISCFIWHATALAQIQSDSIQYKKKGGDITFSQNDEKLNMRQVLNLLEPNEDAFLVMKSARNAKIWGGIAGGIGGFTVGWQLGSFLAGGTLNPIYAGLGVVTIIGSFQINKVYINKAELAIKIYNRAVPQKAKWFQEGLTFGLHSQGLGFQYQF